MSIDGKEQEIEMGSIVNVQNDFLVKPKENIRVNIIGYVNKSKSNESGLKVRKDEIMKRFSLDKKGKIYRVEFYKEDKFSGMILVKFDNNDLSMVLNNY